MMATKTMTLLVALVFVAGLFGAGMGIVAQRAEPVEHRQPDKPPALVIAHEPLNEQEAKKELDKGEEKGKRTEMSKETIKEYLSKSSFVLAGEVISAEKLLTNNTIPAEVWPKDHVAYKCEIKILEEFHWQGGSLKHPTEPLRNVYVIRRADPKDECQKRLKKGEKCIFFFDIQRYGGDASFLPTADPQFGVQPFDAKMTELLRQMGKREKANS